MRRARWTRLLVLLLALGLVAAACSSKSEESTGGEGSSTITVGSDKANNHGSATVSGKEEISVELDSFYFEPTVLKGTAGQQVKLELENESDALHNFTLEDQNLDQDVQAGQKMEVTVTLPQTGFLEFFCKYHKASGMVGELTV
jgi:plastocyanin